MLKPIPVRSLTIVRGKRRDNKKRFQSEFVRIERSSTVSVSQFYLEVVLTLLIFVLFISRFALDSKFCPNFGQKSVTS